jgi:hypothetical protein
MAISASSVPRRRPGVELERVGDQAVMLDASGTVARGLNGSAARVWELIDGVRTVSEIVALVHEDARVEEVLAFLVVLQQKGLIEA